MISSQMGDVTRMYCGPSGLNICATPRRNDPCQSFAELLRCDGCSIVYLRDERNRYSKRFFGMRKQEEDSYSAAHLTCGTGLHSMTGLYFGPGVFGNAIQCVHGLQSSSRMVSITIARPSVLWPVYHPRLTEVNSPSMSQQNKTSSFCFGSSSEMSIQFPIPNPPPAPKLYSAAT